MRVLWISCLIGSITCGPVGKKFSANNADPSSMMRLPFSYGYGYSGMGVSSDSGSSFPQPSLSNPSSDKAAELPAPQDAISSAGAGSYSGSPVHYSGANMAAGNAFYGGYASSGDDSYNSPAASEYGFVYARYGYDNSAPDGGYGSSATAYVGDSWSSGSANSYDGGDENSEPVFSDVSDLEPVYSFSSRSSYQRGRAVFAQTRYSPEEPVPQIMPVSRRMSKTSKPRSPAKAPTKGGF
ncbi:probable ATP-dependent RNA helicase ddx17 [Epinephelus fuscoguttatus]|uniref:probable ATP-dependent RNA helicase ddx17 n=1 Tax=Epinephelus fuscoguttatus TaxID=293821 RepID=UPI0020D09E59|nr:probable ATP-dependent RNA helicase ddx17 [Epinephelus fuscoguttatus]XP_049431260.1 probable ATP-dependent RNA helicase ddx17 [Epinephelus fuscoguttatus]